jgi:hypothetical protein
MASPNDQPKEADDGGFCDVLSLALEVDHFVDDISTWRRNCNSDIATGLIDRAIELSNRNFISPGLGDIAVELGLKVHTVIGRPSVQN